MLLAAWAAAFRAEDPVKLVIKTFPNPHNTVHDDIAALRAQDAELAPIVHLNMDLDDDDLRVLFLGADAMVLAPRRGEGFNVPAAEALAAGVPLLVSAAGGHLDFVGPDTAVLIEGHHAPAASHLTEAGSLWFEPDVAALAAAMRALPREHAAAAARAARARDGVLQALAPDRFATRVRATLADLLLAPQPTPARRIAVVSSWGVRCGIGEYTRFLLEARDDAIATTILCDRRTPAAPGIVPCWIPGHPENAATIAEAVAVADPDILLIEHHPGLLLWDTLATLLRDRRVRGRVVGVTLHNTRHLATLDAPTRLRVRSALAEATRVIVHTPAELDAFRAEDLPNVTFVPQGAPTLRPAEAAAPRRGSAAGPVIGAYGFLLPPKGFGTLIEAFRLLLAEHPQARLRMVTAFYDDSSHPLHAALLARATAEGVADAIDWHTAFLPHRDSLRLLAGCDVVALPYEPTLESSSAALRTVLASGRPTLVTPIEIFGEAAGAVHVAAGHDPGAIRNAIAGLLADAELRRRLTEAQAEWVAARSWTQIARRTFGMLDALFRNAGDGPRRAMREVAPASLAAASREAAV